jgi:hypothetical protein
LQPPEEPQAAASESIEDVYRSLFQAGTAQPELPTREAKSYGLTEAEFNSRADKIVKTLASIANTGADAGYIIFQGEVTAHQLVDAAIVDKAVSSLVHPRIRFDIQQYVIDGRYVDVIRIPKSEHRPHLLKNRGGEIIIPFRGAANNVTAGWHELNEMYDARFRSLFASMLGSRSLEPADDPVGEELHGLDWGGATGSEDPEFVFALVPAKPGQYLKALIEGQHAHSVLNNIFTRTINEAKVVDWFAPHGDFITGPRDGAVELYQTARGGHRIGTVMLYDSGSIIARIWILDPEVYGAPAFFLSHFVSALRGSLQFAHRVYAEADAEMKLELRCALFNAQELTLLVPSAFGTNVALANRDVGRRLFLPKRPIELLSNELDARAPEVADQVGKKLKTHYGP